ncbi:MAG: methyltransferase domain-containing protein [Phycisphaerae bacterium]
MSIDALGGEPANIGGNLYPKYRTRNPIARWLVAGFLSAFRDLAGRTGAHEVLEIGCGEGYLSAMLAAEGRSVRGVDISSRVIETARRNPDAVTHNVRFDVASIFDMDPGKDAAELVVCCEVLEHLHEPQRALALLAKLASPHLLVSVPREPLWRGLNMLRGKYVLQLGNTPSHIQHWSPCGFLANLERYVEIVAVKKPLPWIMALCHTRRNGVDAYTCR